MYHQRYCTFYFFSDIEIYPQVLNVDVQIDLISLKNGNGNVTERLCMYQCIILRVSGHVGRVSLLQVSPLFIIHTQSSCSPQHSRRRRKVSERKKYTGLIPRMDSHRKKLTPSHLDYNSLNSTHTRSCQMRSDKTWKTFEP